VELRSIDWRIRTIWAIVMTMYKGRTRGFYQGAVTVQRRAA
jgi:hypothetical protein